MLSISRYTELIFGLAAVWSASRVGALGDAEHLSDKPALRAHGCDLHASLQIYCFTVRKKRIHLDTSAVRTNPTCCRLDISKDQWIPLDFQEIPALESLPQSVECGPASDRSTSACIRHCSRTSCKSVWSLCYLVLCWP